MPSDGTLALAHKKQTQIHEAHLPVSSEHMPNWPHGGPPPHPSPHMNVLQAALDAGAIPEHSAASTVTRSEETHRTSLDMVPPPHAALQGLHSETDHVCTAHWR